MKFLQKIMSEMGIGHPKIHRTYETVQRSKAHHEKGLFTKPSFDTAPFPSKKCVNCQNINNAEAKFCSECGNGFNAIECATCKNKLEPGSKFCSSCGQKT